MCRKLLCLVALLSIVSVASGQTTLVDDFETYWGTPAMVTPSGPWADASPATSSTLMSLGGAPMAGAYMDLNWTIGGGWADPANPTNYDSVADNAGVGRSFDPYDVTPNTLIHISMKVPQGATLPTGEYLIEYSGDQWSQTWIASWKSGAQWWIPPEQMPAVCWDDAWGYDPYGGTYSALPKLTVGGDWLDLVINADMWVTWGAPLADFDALDYIGVVAFSPQRDPDSSGASGDFKMDGTNVVWPKGPHAGQVLVDNIWFEEVIPEPMTIGLLGLGALALIRRKR
jgi:hypothetical protein